MVCPGHLKCTNISLPGLKSKIQIKVVWYFVEEKPTNLKYLFAFPATRKAKSITELELMAILGRGLPTES